MILGASPLLSKQPRENENMELVKILHDLAITGGAIFIAVLPRFIGALIEAKIDRQDESLERI